ncbi:MAG: hypothetical protein QHI48_02240 [Bacteroidota bacterium]|nr:hypothetical protein [Bacteroidota bacterium]
MRFAPEFLLADRGAYTNKNRTDGEAAGDDEGKGQRSAFVDPEDCFNEEGIDSI